MNDRFCFSYTYSNSHSFTYTKAYTYIKTNTNTYTNHPSRKLRCVKGLRTSLVKRDMIKFGILCTTNSIYHRGKAF